MQYATRRRSFIIDDVRAYVDDVIRKEITEYDLRNTEFLINPTGRFVIGGPDGDTGLTGRKIIVDTYGGYAPMAVVLFQVRTVLKFHRSAHIWHDIWQRTL